MNMDSKVPEVRFEGFGGEWGQDNISNIAPLQRGFDLPKNLIKVGAHPVVMSNGVNCFHNEFKAKAPGVVTGRSGTIGNIHYIDVDYWPHNTSLWVTNFHKNVPLFIYYLYVKLDLKRFGTGSGVPTLNRNDVHVQSVALPKDSKEQTVIGNYFQKLDALINQHQQKHGKLSSIKKAMLEKMFPKQGETIPEIRFKGFSGEWVERSWSDTVDISTNMVDPRNCQYGELFHVGPGNIESFTGRFYNNVLKVKDSNLISGKFHFNKGDIIYGKINPQLAKYVIAPFEGLASADAYVLNTKNGVVQNYLFAILHTEDFYKYTVSVSSRTGMPKINRDELNIYSYMAPSESEQTQIGNYFQKLDALINQHQQQITKLNNIKLACLSKMFV